MEFKQGLFASLPIPALAFESVDLYADPTEVYGRRIAEVVEPFLGTPVTPMTIRALTEAVTVAQRDFLYDWPRHVALKSLEVYEHEPGYFQVDAPICTHAEKRKIDYEDAERARLLAQLLAEADIERERAIKREANMHRMHRRLMRRHADRIPPSTRTIWPSLSVGQQYAILKDIDFEVRHEQHSVPR